MEPVCKNPGCGHTASEHGARGYGACRAGMAAALRSGMLTAPICRCPRFRVRPVKSADVDRKGTP